MEELESPLTHLTPLVHLTPLAPRVSLAPLGPGGTAASAPRPLAPALAPAAPGAHAAKAKPDARPMRMMLGAGGLAAFSAIATAIIMPPSSAAVGAPAGGSSSAQGAPAAIQQPVQYIQLQPGQTAPPGAKVIDATAPQPVTVVTTVPAPAQKPIIIKTTQSGKVVK